MIAAAVLGVAGCLAPFINAARFSGRIQQALENSLGRRVTFEKAYFSIFTGPGFSLENVTIGEDPHYGIEPFAFVPVLHARLRVDKLLTGDIRFANLQLVDPSLNLVKQIDGSWNVVDLMQRLGAPRRLPLSLFPALEVSDGRVDFKFGLRKTTLYILNTDISVYPERSGKLYIRFSGSPARTDRAGIGFGHLRGDINWYLNAGPKAKQLEASVVLDPSNLSEITTLIGGHDAGVHGTVSSHLQIAGPITDLQLAGDLRLKDVHRWDLMPASGEEWPVRYGGHVDLLAQRADLQTVNPSGQLTPVAIRLRVEDFLSQPKTSIIADLKDAPLADLVPLASRLGIGFPKGAELLGSVNGAVGYAKESGWNGGVAIEHAEAVLPGVPQLRTKLANVTIVNDNVHLDPAALETDSGSLKLSADYVLASGAATVTLAAGDVPVDELKSFASSWLGDAGPLAAMSDGLVSGLFSYQGSGETGERAGELPGGWSGQLVLRDATISIPGISLPLQDVRGRLSMHGPSFTMDHLVGSLGGQTVRASYRYDPLAKMAERARVELSRADLSQLEDLLAGSTTSESFWSRFRLGKKSSTNLGKRNLEGDLMIDQFFAEGQPLGALSSHFIWRGSSVELTKTMLKLAQGRIEAHGTVDLSASDPHWKFTAVAANFPWAGGLLNVEGEFTSTGSGKNMLRNLMATGTFTGEQVELSNANTFENVSGEFQISFANGWPELRLSKVQAVQNGDQWTGDGLSSSDGKLMINLAHGDKQMHVVSSLQGATRSSAPVSSAPIAVDSHANWEHGLKF